MPLNNMQKRMIIATIDHLLDFPNDPVKNHLAEKALIAIFTDASVDPADAIAQDDKEAYSLLRKYIEHPENYFQGITKVSTETVTIGEIQKYILDLIVHRLKTALSKKSPDENISNTGPFPDETETQLEESVVNPFFDSQGKGYLNTLQVKPEWNMTFDPIAVSSPTDEDDIYQLSGLEGAIYSARIGFEIEEQQAIYKDENSEMQTISAKYYVPIILINVALSQTEITKRKLYFGCSIMATQGLDEDEYDQLMESAEKVARNYAANAAMFYLTEKGILSFDQSRLQFVDAVISAGGFVDTGSSDSQNDAEIEQLNTNIKDDASSQVEDQFPSEESGDNSSDVTEDVKDDEQLSLYLLITNQYYYRQVRLKTHSLWEYDNIPVEIAKYLIRPAIIKLLEECDFDFTVLSCLPANELDRLIHPNLFQLFKNKIFRHDQISFMTPCEFSFVTHPVYNRLLQDKRIKTDHIWNMSNVRKSMLFIPFIANLISQHKIEFKDALLLPIKLMPIFSKQSYAEYFNKQPNLLLMTCVFSNHQCSLLIEVMDLVINGQITFEQIKETTDWHIRVILSNNNILLWIKEKLIKFDDIKDLKNKKEFLDFYGMGFAKKLFKLIGLARPEDEASSEKIKDFLSQFPFVCNSKELESAFRERVLYHCVILMQFKMAKMRAQYFGFPQVKTTIQKILDEILEIKFSKNKDWSGALKSITIQSQDLLNIILDIKENPPTKTMSHYSYFLLFNQLPQLKKKLDNMNMFLFNLGRFHELIDPEATKTLSPLVLRTKCE